MTNPSWLGSNTMSEDIMSMNTDYCAKCGAEHGYMCGPCKKCGSHVFTKEKPHKTDDATQKLLRGE